MPRISAFYGIVIAMYFSDHPPAHFMRDTQSTTLRSQSTMA
jgi:hypothetical protein